MIEKIPLLYYDEGRFPPESDSAANVAQLVEHPHGE